jgi:hypothetical protein
MVTRYNSTDDAVPHEENLLILTTSNRCYGREYPDIVQEIRDGIRGDKLLIEEYFHSLDDLENWEKLIRNSVWIINWQECMENEDLPCLKFYLDTKRYPNEAEVILCVNGNEKAKEVRSSYPKVTVAKSKEALVSYAKGHLNTANPISQGGIKKVMEWNNEVCDELGVP